MSPTPARPPLPDAAAALVLKTLAVVGARTRAPDPDRFVLTAGQSRLAAEAARAWITVCSWHADFRRWDAAEAVAWMVGELRPDDVDAWLSLAVIHLRRPGFDPNAVAVFLERAVTALTRAAPAITPVPVPASGGGGGDGDLLPDDAASADGDEPPADLPAFATALTAWTTAADRAGPGSEYPAARLEVDDGSDDVEAVLLARAHPAWRAALALGRVSFDAGLALGALAESASVPVVAAIYLRAAAADARDDHDRQRAFARLSDLLEAWRAAAAVPPPPGTPGTPGALVDAPEREYVRISAAEVNAELFAANVVDAPRRDRLLDAWAAGLASSPRIREWRLLRSLMPGAMAARPWREPDGDDEWSRWVAWLENALRWALPAPPPYGEAGERAYAEWRAKLLRAGGGEAWSDLLLALDQRAGAWDARRSGDAW